MRDHHHHAGRRQKVWRTSALFEPGRRLVRRSVLLLAICGAFAATLHATPRTAMAHHVRVEAQEPQGQGASIFGSASSLQSSEAPAGIDAVPPPDEGLLASPRRMLGAVGLKIARGMAAVLFLLLCLRWLHRRRTVSVV